MRRFPFLGLVLCIGGAFTEARTLYFPHYGDGGGLSMTFTVLNSADTTAFGSIQFFDSSGAPQGLPILSRGVQSKVDFSLGPHGSLRLQTTGGSSPLRSGFATVTSFQESVSGVAIYRFASGIEASVLPAQEASRVTLPAEISAFVNTGIAVACAGSGDLQFSLFDPYGTLVYARTLLLAGRQRALFLDEVFLGLPETFQGILAVESEDAACAAVGLRFGNNVLSTIPVLTGSDSGNGSGPAAGPFTADAMFSPKGGIRDRLISEISKATTSIDIAIYSFTADELRQALISARSRGVQVRIVADRGQAGGTGGEIPYLESLGFQVRRCNGGNSSGYMHNKYMIVDGQTLFTGSYNWSANAEDNSYENALFVSRAPVIADYVADFARLLQCTQPDSGGGDGGGGGTTPPPAPPPPSCSPSLIVVWVNTNSGVYHCPGTYYYGNTKEGKYMTQGAAKAAGHRPAYGRECSCN